MLLNVEKLDWVGLGDVFHTKNTASRPFAGGLRMSSDLFKFESRSRESPNLAGDTGDTFLFSMDVSLYLYYLVILYQK